MSIEQEAHTKRMDCLYNAHKRARKTIGPREIARFKQVCEGYQAQFLDTKTPINQPPPENA